jgi:hypothetical protein
MTPNLSDWALATVKIDLSLVKAIKTDTLQV